MAGPTHQGDAFSEVLQQVQRYLSNRSTFIGVVLTSLLH